MLIDRVCFSVFIGVINSSRQSMHLQLSYLALFQCFVSQTFINQLIFPLACLWNFSKHP